MARHAPTSVSYSKGAEASLIEILEWNVNNYGKDHTARYLKFIRDETKKLIITHSFGKPVRGNPGLLYFTIRRRRGSHGHVVVYKVKRYTVYIIGYYHSAQDWVSRL